MPATNITYRDFAAFWHGTLAERAADATKAIINAGAERMVKQPWRIVLAVHPERMAAWPPVGTTPDKLREDCERLLAAEIARGAAGHWTHDGNRLIALRQASIALARLNGEPA